MSLPDSIPGLKGLVLAGGRSRRMKQDKALLQYHGRPQVLVAYDLICGFCDEVFISCREGQWTDTEILDHPLLFDEVADQGPMGGILSAFSKYPDSPWLVVACDLPFLSPATLEKLCTNREPSAVATAFQSNHDGLPEPLCAIYEPRSMALMQEYMQQDRRCPRKLLINSDARLLDLPAPRELDNINHPDEHAETVLRFSNDS